MTDETNTEVTTEENAAQDENVTTQPQGEQVAEQEKSTTSTDESGNDSGADPAADETGNKTRGVQKRIDELTANWRSEQRRAEFLERQYEFLQKQIDAQKVEKPKEEPAKPQAAPKPKLDDFETEEQFFEALTDWKTEQRFVEWENKQQEAARKRQEQEREKAQAQTRQQKQADFAKRANEYAADKPDYWTVVQNPNVTISEAMLDAIVESDMGPQVAYHLGQHPAESSRIAQLSPVAAAREVGRLEMKLSIPPKPKVSQAPEPPKTVGGGGEQAAKDPDQMSIGQWMAKRNRDIGLG